MNSQNSSAVKRRMTYTAFLDTAPMTGFLWLIIISISVAQIFDGFDFQITSFALPGIIKEFGLNLAEAGVVSSAGNIGLVVGAAFFSILADRIGRKPIFQWVLFTFVLGSFFSAIAPSYQTLLAARFVAGLGIGAEIPVAVAILAEYAPLRYRHIFVPLATLFFSVGWPLAALVSLGLIEPLGWRSIYLVGIVPVLVILAVRRLMPESVRFLLTKGKREEADRVMKDFARRAGATDIELVPPAAEEGEMKLTLSQQVAVLKTGWAPILVLGFFFFTYLLQLFSINAWLPTIFVRQGFTLATSFTYTLIIFSVTPLCHVFAMWVQNRMDRKWALFLLTMMGSVLLTLFGLSFQLKWPIQVAIGFQFLQVLLGQGSVSIFFTLAGEIFPTHVRTVAVGFMNSFGRLGAVVGPVALGFLLGSGTSIGTIILFFAIPVVIAAVIALFVIKVDPRNQQLEKVAAEAAYVEVGAAVAH